MANLTQDNYGYRISLASYISITGIGGAAADIGQIHKTSKYLITEFKPTEGAGPGSSTKVTVRRKFTPWTDISGPMNAIGVSNPNQIESIFLDLVGPTVTFSLYKVNI